MAAIHLLNGLDSGHGCYPPRPNLQGSPNVNVEGTPIHRQGDLWAPHQCGSDVHTSVLAQGSTTVFVNGKGCGRIGDPVACGSVTIDGAVTVFAGG